MNLETPNPIQQYLKNQQMPSNTVPSRAGHQLNIAGMKSDLHPRVLGLIAGFEPEKDNDALSSLQAISSQLTRSDLHEIISKTPDTTKTHRWARKKLRAQKVKN